MTGLVDRIDFPIERFGGTARQAVDKGEFNDALDSIVDAIILYAGVASIFGGEKLRSAAAHGLYNGFTKIPTNQKGRSWVDSRIF